MAVKKASTENLVRLGCGMLINVAVWQACDDRLGSWGMGLDGEVKQAMVSAALATAGLVLVIPTCWRGKGWQRVLGFLLIALPTQALSVAVNLAIFRL
jgi:hypothetical protein